MENVKMLFAQKKFQVNQFCGHRIVEKVVRKILDLLSNFHRSAGLEKK